MCVAGIDCYVLVIDDNSRDGAANVVARLAEITGKVSVIVRPRRVGLGSAYIDGFKHVLEKMKDADVVVEMDTDGSHDPKLLPQLVNPVLKGESDVVGSHHLFNRHKGATCLGGVTYAKGFWQAYGILHPVWCYDKVGLDPHTHRSG